MKVDVSKLRASVKRLAEGRRDGRKSSDLMATIRPLMPAIERFRADDVPWAVIAASLAEQGVVEGDSRPLSEKRLTSVVSKLKEQEAKRNARMQARALRGDLATAPNRRRPPSSMAGTSQPRLAPELTTVRVDAETRPPISEAEILREKRDKHQHLFKKD